MRSEMPIRTMKGYVTVPVSMHAKSCKYCGAQPVVVLVDGIRYVVKCPNNNSHYQTKPGVIDIDDWNIHNTSLYDE